MSDIFDDFLPKRKIGYLYPLHVIDYSAYQFYQLVPGIMLVILPLGLGGFTPKDVERAFARLEEYLAIFVEHGVDIIMQSGVPLPIIMGLEYHDNLLVYIKKATGLPATSSVMNVVAATKFLGIRNIALANKWNPNMNNVLGLFFAREGIRVAGINSRSMEPSEFGRLKTEESLMLAYELGREVLRSNPDADGLYIGGGAWLTIPIIKPIEDEFGKPVITNENATIWHVCHLIDYWKPIHGYGRLLQSV